MLARLCNDEIIVTFHCLCSFGYQLQPYSLTAKTIAMFKRTKGYLLLIMLMLTGLAGKIHNDTLSGKERRNLVKEIKITKSDFMKSLSGLSNKQLNFKPEKSQLSIKECIYKLVSIENQIWGLTKEGLKQAPPALKKSFNDDELTSCITVAQNLVPVKELKFKNVKEATKVYKNESSEILKYVNTSTENIRTHVIPSSIGNLDAYQLMLLITKYTKFYTDYISGIKSTSNFPK